MDLRTILVVVSLSVAACTSSTTNVLEGADPSATRTQSSFGEATEPPVLTGVARELMAARVAEFDGPDGPSELHGAPGRQLIESGESVAYDRWCIVGDRLRKDQVFDEFVVALREAGGEFRVLHSSRDGRVEKILVNLDGRRIVVSPLQW